MSTNIDNQYTEIRMTETLIMVTLIVLIAMGGVIFISLSGGNNEFAMILAGIASGTVVALFKYWPF